MSKRVAFIFPGQGAQVVGMGKDFFDQFPEAKAVFDEADAVLEEAFSDLIFNGPESELTLTKNSQLAIFITSIAILRVVQSQCPELVAKAFAGLSLGEYTALVAAGKLTFKEGLLIVAARGHFMHEACEAFPGTMSVVLGLELDLVKEVLDTVEGAWVANLNCPGQIVISGTHEGIEKAAVLLKEKGARRVMPLNVSGAFHSGLMQQAQDRLQPLIENVDLKNTSTTVVMNVYGSAVSSKEKMKHAMVEQVTKPVLWQKGIEALVEDGIEVFVEIGPGKTLAGMNKRIGVSAETLSVEKIADLEGVQHAPIS